MRIHDYSLSTNGAPSQVQPLETTAVPLSGPRQDRTAGPTGVGDSVELSGSSLILQASDGQRADRIQSLSSQVRAGSYKVDAQTVAGAVVAETLASGRSELNA